MTFTILLSIYNKETPENVSACFNSLLQQTVKASEIILVKDGQLSEILLNEIAKWEKLLPLKVIGYENNHGLAYALNFGLQFCSNQLVARMDTDDICANNRFEIQLSEFTTNPNLALCSGYIAEFVDTPQEITGIKKLPLTNEKIKQYAKKRNPFNHMAVMFKKDIILKLNGYADVSLFEDYDLWIRLIHVGYEVKNIDKILVFARAGENMLQRRRGIEYIKKELFFLKRLQKIHFITQFEYIKLIITRIPVRILPAKVLYHIYSVFLRKKTA